jgi:predicted O-linked N-acetylglucosamine transferase (SPINDLY family)/glycosyltransferase involved in cell wall biosynthesis
MSNKVPELRRFAPVTGDAPRPFWSVMIPTFNRTDLLVRTLRSLMAQNPLPGKADMQIEVVDNASDQVDVRAIVTDVGNGRISYFRQERNIGAFPNFHTCIDRARGRWVHILNDDDLVLPGFYKTLRQGLEKHSEAGMAVTGVAFIDDNDRQIGAMPPACSAPGIIPNWIESVAVMQRQQVVGTVVRRDVYEAVGGFRMELKSAADWEMWARIAAKYPVYGTPEILAKFRLHGGSWSTDAIRRADNTRDTRAVIEVIRGYLPKDRGDSLANTAFAHYALSGIDMARQALHRGDLAAAAAQLRESLLSSSAPQVRNAAAGLAADFDRYGNWLANQVNQLIKDSSDQSARAALHTARQSLANAWLAMPDDQLEWSYTNGLGKIQGLLAFGQPKLEAQEHVIEEPAVVERFADLRSGDSPQDLKNPAVARRFLAAMPYLRADQLLRGFDVPAVPQWLINDYLRFIHESPHLFNQLGEADEYADFMERWVAYLHEQVTANPGNEYWRSIATYFAQAGNFIAFYFNYRNLKDTYRRRAVVVEQVLKALGHQVDFTFPPRDSNRRKIRLGILSAHYNPQTETFATLPFYKHLNREVFESILFTAHGSGHRLERYCAGHADALVVLPQQGGFPAQVQTIRQADLDMILIATNVTAVTNPITILAVHRLARVQVNSVCSCVTSGMSNNDYYISGRATEPADNPQGQYTETLRLIDGPAHCCDFGSEEHSLATEHPTRASLGIPADAIVFISGSNFYKVIPEVQEVWADVLARVPNSRLLLYPFNPNWSNAYPTESFIRRLRASLRQRGLDPQRVMVFPPVAGRGDILERLKVADIYLDSFPFSGITSLIDPLEIGIPPVVMDGNAFRSLMAPALMRELGLPQLIAADKQSYIDTAVRLAEDANLRREMTEKIRSGMAGQPKFRNSRWYSAQVEGLLKEMLREKQVPIVVM